MLKINKLSIEVDGKKILNDISLSFDLGKTYFLLGKNWSWKSSLAMSIAWHPKYKISNWNIFLDDKDIIAMTPDERSRLWIFLSFQNIPEIPWIRLSEFLRTIYNQNQKSKNPDSKDITPFMFSRILKKYLDDIWLPESFASRDLNVWFSWWEKRKIELLQIKLLEPKFIILDEIDSWLDIDAFKVVASSLANLKNPENTLIFITHNFNLMDFIDVDRAFVMDKWNLIDSWDKSLIEKIKKHWYCDYCKDVWPECNLVTKCA